MGEIGLEITGGVSLEIRMTSFAAPSSVVGSMVLYIARITSLNELSTTTSLTSIGDGLINLCFSGVDLYYSGATEDGVGYSSTTSSLMVSSSTEDEFISSLEMAPLTMTSVLGITVTAADGLLEGLL